MIREHDQEGLRLGSVFGTPIFIEPGFFILAALFVMIELQRGSSIQEALLWVPTLFISVLIHEFGHAAMIALLGFGSSVVVIGGTGGHTTNARNGRPWQNILISLAGPFTEAAFAALLYFAYFRIPFLHTDRMMVAWIPLMIGVNFFWAIFNLLPIFPLDGGNVLRQSTAWFLTNRRSFQITTWVSMILSVVLVVYGLASRNFFFAAISASLLLQNYQRWDHFRHSGFPD